MIIQKGRLQKAFLDIESKKSPRLILNLNFLAFSAGSEQSGDYSEYKEFPANADFIIETIENLYKKVPDVDQIEENVYENVSPPPSSNSDSGIGFKDNNVNQAVNQNQVLNHPGGAAAMVPGGANALDISRGSQETPGENFSKVNQGYKSRQNQLCNCR